MKNKKKNRRMKRITGYLLTAMAVLMLNACAKPQTPAEPTETPLAAEETPEPEERKVDYAVQKKINEDYLGYLYFESGLVEELVVQGEDNEYYLNYTANKEYSSHGAVYLDYRNDLKDQNLIFYGHYVYADESLVFSPLHQLKEESNYEGNKRIVLELEEEIREYDVAYVYYYEMGNEDLEYFHPYYGEEELEHYLESVEAKQFYDTGIEIEEEDHFLTLQTCVRNRDDLRLIVIAKEVSSE